MEWVQIGNKSLNIGKVILLEKDSGMHLIDEGVDYKYFLALKRTSKYSYEQ